MKGIIIYMIGCALLYFIPSCIGAFAYLDWEFFDFYTWDINSRATYAMFVLLWTILAICYICAEKKTQ